MKEIIVMAAIVFGGLLLWLFLHREKPRRYRQKSVLTGSDLDFFFRLREALPTCIVCPQVAISALLEPAGNGMARQEALARIVGGKVGYAVFDAQMRLLTVVELDHRSRLNRRDAAREACFSSAGIRTVRFPAKRPPSVAQIHASVLAQVPARGRSRTIGRNTEFSHKRAETPWRNTTKIRI